jgi:hypothetical protein
MDVYLTCTVKLDKLRKGKIMSLFSILFAIFTFFIGWVCGMDRSGSLD